MANKTADLSEFGYYVCLLTNHYPGPTIIKIVSTCTWAHFRHDMIFNSHKKFIWHLEEPYSTTCQVSNSERLDKKQTERH